MAHVVIVADTGWKPVPQMTSSETIALPADAGPEALVVSSPVRTSTRSFLVVLVWLIVFGTALALDRPVSTWLHQTGIDADMKFSRWAPVLKAAGEFWFAAAIAVVVAVAAKRVQDGLFVLVAA